MVDSITPSSPPGAASPGGRFSPVEAAVLLRLAEGEFVKNLARAALQARVGQTKAASAESFLGQDLTNLGGDARGGRVNLLI